MRRQRGFTLLEVVVALAILSLSLMAIFDLNAGALANHGYTKRITVASLLARSKMIDLEQKLYEEGLPSQDDEESGDFSEEGWPNFKWRAKIIAPETTGVSTDKLLSALFNLPVGGEGEGESGIGALAAMFGGGMGAEGGVADALGAAGGAGPLGGAMGGVAQAQLTQFLEQITQTVREVHLTVSWRAGTEVETLDVVTHVVMLAPGADRNGASAAGGGAAAAAQAQDGDPWVNSYTGQAISGDPVQCRHQLCDPADGTTPVVRRSQHQANQDRISRRRGQGPLFGGKKGLRR